MTCLKNTMRAARLGALLAITAAATSAASAQTYRAAVAATNPIASFQLDAPNTASANGTYTTNWQNVTAGPGAPLASVPGNIGAAFDGVGAVSQITTSLAGMTPGRGSIVAWINLASLPSTAGRIFYIAGESQSGNDFDFQISNANRLSFCVGAGGGECFETQLDASFAGQWHMVAAAYDGTINGGQDTQALFIDGAVAASRLTDLSDAGHGSAFTIGYSSVFGDREFDGSIDEVSVYDRALTAGEVSSLYAARLVGGNAGAVPEPATWAMMILGMGGTGAVLRRRRRAMQVAA